VVASDLDRDGDLDLVVNNFRQAPVVLKNLSDTRNRWIGLKLEGKAPNTRALGARVKVSAGQWSALRAVSCGSEYLGQQDGTILVGVGKEKKVRVEVRWPSGQLQRWTLSTNQFKTLVEGP
jgi:hypothetical protein